MLWKVIWWFDTRILECLWNGQDHGISMLSKFRHQSFFIQDLKIYRFGYQLRYLWGPWGPFLAVSGGRSLSLEVDHDAAPRVPRPRRGRGSGSRRWRARAREVRLGGAGRSAEKCWIIELDDGKIYRKALYLMVKTMVSCRFSLKPIHWLEILWTCENMNMSWKYWWY